MSIDVSALRAARLPEAVIQAVYALDSAVYQQVKRIEAHEQTIAAQRETIETQRRLIAALTPKEPS